MSVMPYTPSESPQPVIPRQVRRLALMYASLGRKLPVRLAALNFRDRFVIVGSVNILKSLPDDLFETLISDPQVIVHGPLSPASRDRVNETLDNLAVIAQDEMMTSGDPLLREYLELTRERLPENG